MATEGKIQISLLVFLDENCQLLWATSKSIKMTSLCEGFCFVVSLLISFLVEQYKKHHEGGIEKSVPRITYWHHEAYGDHEGQISLSHPHTNTGLFFLLTTKYLII